MEPLSTVNNAFKWFANVSLWKDNLLRKLILRIDKKRQKTLLVYYKQAQMSSKTVVFASIKQNHSMEAMILPSQLQFY